jgi:hypothetical protein
MTAFLPVAPPNYLASYFLETSRRNAFFLAHDVAANLPAYEQLRKQYLTTNFDQNLPFNIRIMDNSVIELGEFVNTPMIVSAVDAVGPCVVVLPDVLEKGEQTFNASARALSLWKDLFCGDRGCDLMFVPQGSTFLDWVMCLESFLNYCEDNKLDTPRWIGIPRNATDRICTSRFNLVTIVKKLYPAARIHLLGFSDNMVDDMVSTGSAWGYSPDSIDSAVPMRTMDFMLSIRLPKRGIWWEEASKLPLGSVPNWAIENAKRFQSWVK